MVLKKHIVKCHCGARAVLRQSTYIYGNHAKDGYLYVCSRYPVCDSYVGAHTKSRKPMGFLANGELRSKRIQAHRAFDRLWKSGLMTRSQAYIWMQAKFSLNGEQAHIALFSEYMCDQLIAVCSQVIRNNRLAA